jgi:hypothetical protein
MIKTIDVFKRYLRSEIEEACAGKEIVVYGAGNLARSFLNITGVNPEFYVETGASGARHFRGKVVESPKILEGRKDELFVFVCSQWSSEIAKVLTGLGYQENQNFKIATFVAPTHLILYCESAASSLAALSWLNKNVEYVKLRYFDYMIEAGEDWDILIRSADLPKVLDCPYFMREKTDFPFDFKWSEPLGFQEERLYFPESTGRSLLKNKEYDSRGFFRVSEKDYRNIYLYHLTYQKNILFDSDDVRKYRAEFIKITRGELTFDFENCFDALTRARFHPPLSHARKWASVMRNLLLMKKLDRCDKKSQIGIFVCREAANEVMIDLLKKSMEKSGLIWLGDYALSDPEMEIFRLNMRGGCWGENPASKEAGAPSILVFFLDHFVPPVDKNLDEFSEERFQVEKWRAVKHDVRMLSVDNKINSSGVNWLHSVEDEKETLEAVGWLEPKGKIFFEKLLLDAELGCERG